MNLSNFHDTLNSLARVVASLSGLPPHYLGYATENPASADGIRSSESRHTVKLYSADRLLPRRFTRRALGYSDTDIRDMEAGVYSRVVGGDQAAEFGPKPLPSPRRPANDESEVPQPRRPVNGLGASVLPPTAVQFSEPAACG